MKFLTTYEGSACEFEVLGQGNMNSKFSNATHFMSQNAGTIHCVRPGEYVPPAQMLVLLESLPHLEEEQHGSR